MFQISQTEVVVQFNKQKAASATTFLVTSSNCLFLCPSSFCTETTILRLWFPRIPVWLVSFIIYKQIFAGNKTITKGQLELGRGHASQRGRRVNKRLLHFALNWVQFHKVLLTPRRGIIKVSLRLVITGLLVAHKLHSLCCQITNCCWHQGSGFVSEAVPVNT